MAMSNWKKMHFDCISSFLVQRAQQEMKIASLLTLKVCIEIEQGTQYLKNKNGFSIFLTKNQTRFLFYRDYRCKKIHQFTEKEKYSG